MAEGLKLVFLDEVPKLSKRAGGKYETAISQFIKSGRMAARVSAPNAKAATVMVASFRRVIKAGKHKDISCVKRGTDVYLTREGMKE